MTKVFLPYDIARCVDNDMCSKRTTCKRHLAPGAEQFQWVISGRDDCEEYIPLHEVVETTRKAWGLRERL